LSLSAKRGQDCETLGVREPPVEWPVESMEETVATVVLVIIAWLIFLLPAVSLSLPICLLGRKRAQFRLWEVSAFVVPFIIWLVCFQLLAGGKSLGNIIEAAVLGGSIPLIVLIRTIIGGYLNRSLVATGLMGLDCVFAFVLATMFPEVHFNWFH